MLFRSEIRTIYEAHEKELLGDRPAVLSLIHIFNAEGIGHSTGMARRIEAATGIETRATILGYMLSLIHI